MLPLLLALPLVGARYAPPLTQAPPSVLVFVLDDVAAQDLALYGGPVAMPYLEQLAAAGVTLENAYSHAFCAPTRQSLCFGKWAQNEAGPLCASGGVAFSETSLAEALPGHVSALLGKWHLGGLTIGPWQQAPIGHGFDYWGVGIPGNIEADVACGTITNPSYTNWLRVDADLGGYSVAVSTAYHGIALRDFFVNGWPAAPKPALGIVSCQLPHAPFEAPPAALLPQGYVVGTTNRAKYEAMLRAMDKLLGQMLAHVSLSDTLIVVLGDNGTPPNAGGGTKSKGTVFERGVRVPLIVAGGPTVNGGRTSAALVHVMDVYATALEACGAAVPVGSDSVSFLGELTQGQWTPRDFLFLGDRWQDVTNLPGERGAVSASGWKLRQLDNDGNGTVDGEQLYDLGSDPGETTNLVNQSTEDDALRAWLAAHAP